MPHTKPAVFGIYAVQSGVESAVLKLKDAGFAKSEISVLFPHNDAHKDLVHVKSTKAVEGAEMGASAGAIIGGVLGWLASIGMLAIPGIGAVIVAGPIATILISAGAIAGMGGLWGGLIGLGISEKEAKHYMSRLHQGDILLSVHCVDADRVLCAKEIMIETNAEDVYSRLALSQVAY